MSKNELANLWLIRTVDMEDTPKRRAMRLVYMGLAFGMSATKAKPMYLKALREHTGTNP